MNTFKFLENWKDTVKANAQFGKCFAGKTLSQFCGRIFATFKFFGGRPTGEGGRDAEWADNGLSIWGKVGGICEDIRKWPTKGEKIKYPKSTKINSKSLKKQRLNVQCNLSVNGP